MATMNPFDLLGDDDHEDPTQLIAAPRLKVEKPKKASGTVPTQAQAQPAKSAKFPSKPVPPTQAVKEAKNEGGRGGGGRGGGRASFRGRGGGSGFNRDSNINEAAYGNNNGFAGGYRPSEEGDAGKLPSEKHNYGGPPRGYRGGVHRGGFSNGETGEGERPRRVFDRRSGTGRGNEIKREGSGRGNWGTPADDIAPETEEPVIEIEKNIGLEKQSGEEDAADVNKNSPVNEPEEDKEMTLEEYEKIREEKRKALLSSKAEERKVDVEKEFGSMLQLSNKKENDDIFFNLGSEKDKRKDAADKEERAKKAVSINEFLRPADGERYYSGGRGRGRSHSHGRGQRGGYGGGRDVAAPSIEDPGQFPSLGGK